MQGCEDHSGTLGIVAPTKPIAEADTCPCRLGTNDDGSPRLSYANCCQPWHVQGFAGLGATPETTMRSRYSAYVVQDEAYLLATWHPDTRPEAVQFATDVEWHGLTVHHAVGAGLDATGSVEFSARFRRGDAHLKLHELSEFSQVGGRWYYVACSDPDDG